jgi:hypothetical protein
LQEEVMTIKKVLQHLMKKENLILKANEIL